MFISLQGHAQVAKLVCYRCPPWVNDGGGIGLFDNRWSDDQMAHRQAITSVDRNLYEVLEFVKVGATFSDDGAFR